MSQWNKLFHSTVYLQKEQDWQSQKLHETIYVISLSQVTIIFDYLKVSLVYKILFDNFSDTNVILYIYLLSNILFLLR